MTSPTPETPPPRPAPSLLLWYAVFAAVALGVLLYFMLGREMPVLFDVLATAVTA